MATRLWILSSVTAVVLCSVVSCKDHQACERARMKMADTWETVKYTAGKRKVPPGHVEATSAEKAQQRALWQPIEDQAETLRSSFETTQITWDAAEKAHKVLQEKYSQVPAGGDVMSQGFGAQLKMATAEYQQFREQCR